jgi:hypothetical protein
LQNVGWMMNQQEVNNHQYDLPCLGQILQTQGDILNYDHLSPNWDE